MVSLGLMVETGGGLAVTHPDVSWFMARYRPVHSDLLMFAQ